MKILTFLLLIISFISAQENMRKLRFMKPEDLYQWDNIDKALLITTTALTLVDMYQTHLALKSNKVYETNNIIFGKNPKTGKVLGVKLGGYALITFMASQVKSTERKFLLAIVGVGFNVWVVHNNANVMAQYKISFTF